MPDSSITTVPQLSIKFGEKDSHRIKKCCNQPSLFLNKGPINNSVLLCKVYMFQVGLCIAMLVVISILVYTCLLCACPILNSSSGTW